MSNKERVFDMACGFVSSVGACALWKLDVCSGRQAIGLFVLLMVWYILGSASAAFAESRP